MIELKICDIVKFNRESYSNKDNFLYVNYLDTGNITMNKVDEIQFIDLKEEKLPSRARRKVKVNNIIYSTVRPNQCHYGIIKEIPDNFLVSTGFAVMEVDEKKVDPDYLYYWLTMTERTEKLHAIAEQSVSTYPSIKPSDIGDLEIELPDLSTQRKIKNILSSIDSKIVVNNRINDNLLEQALTIYSNSIQGKIKNGCIGDYCSVKSGFAFKSSWWTQKGIKVIKIGSINQDNLDLNSCAFVEPDKYDKAKDFSVVAGDLLIAMTGATIGKFTMVPFSNEKLLVNQRVGKFFLGNTPLDRLPYIYCTLKQQDVFTEIINRGQGSAQPNISASDIMSIPCVILEHKELDDFNNICKPIFEAIIHNQFLNEELSRCRDTLLPKLMSGELDVSSIDLDV